MMIARITRKISPTVSCLLWGRAAGRCEFKGCNKLLVKSAVTQEEVNIGQKAHIYAFSEHGPRGNKGISGELLNSTANLILVCHQCHQKLDNKRTRARYTVELVRSMKNAHERRIRTITGINPNKPTYVLHYTANIDQHNTPLDFNTTAHALFPMRYPADEYPIELSLSRSVRVEKDEEFWKIEEEHLKKKFSREVLSRVEDQSIKHLSVFALAPQPLLILLGSLLGDIVDTDVYAHHKEPKGWKWQKKGPPLKLKTKLKSHRVKPAKVALVLSISGTVTDDRIRKVLGSKTSIWRVDHPAPYNDCLKCSAQLREFRVELRKQLNQIKETCGQQTVLNIFPAMPAALAVELGRIRNPKADMPWRIFDQVSERGGFIPALELSREQAQRKGRN